MDNKLSNTQNLLAEKTDVEVKKIKVEIESLTPDILEKANQETTAFEDECGEETNKNISENSKEKILTECKSLSLKSDVNESAHVPVKDELERSEKSLLNGNVLKVEKNITNVESDTVPINVNKNEISDTKTGNNLVNKVANLTIAAKEKPNAGEVILTNPTSNSLSVLQGYLSSEDSESDSSFSNGSDDDSDSTEDNEENVEPKVTEADDDDSSTSSSHYEYIDSLIEDSSDDEAQAIKAVVTAKDPKKKSKTAESSAVGDVNLEVFPPVPDLSTLKITDAEEFTHIGNVESILDRLVTIQSLLNTPALDLDSLLFVENGTKPLGFIFDVLGPVTSPLYVVRFNSIEDIASLNLEKGTKVYYAPKSQHTQYVFLQQLMKMRGSDASWEGDLEVPDEFADYSDDEIERQQLRCKTGPALGTKRKRNSLERHKDFERSMNTYNRFNSRIYNFIDSRRRNDRPRAASIETMANTPAPNAVFDPSVPPPGYPRLSESGFYDRNPLVSQPLSPFFQSPSRTFFDGVMTSSAPFAGFYQPQTTTFSSPQYPGNMSNYYSNNYRNNGPGPSNRH